MDLLRLWQMAAASPLGIRITTDDRDLLRQQLYRARAEAGGFQDIVMIYPKQEGQLLLVHRDADERGGTDEGDLQGIQEGLARATANLRSATSLGGSEEGAEGVAETEEEE